MRCPSCGHENRDEATFCGECAALLAAEVVCAACSRKNPTGRKFCDGCAAPLAGAAKPSKVNGPRSYTPPYLAEKILSGRTALEGERRTVTALFADAVGFTPLSERLDEEEVYDLMQGCLGRMMDAVHRYEGTVTQFRGDGVMALFGAPIAHEDAARRAVAAALEMQKSLDEYAADVKQQHSVGCRFRVGLNTGPVVVGKISDDLDMDYTALGDTVNLAARMEELADPGAVYLSENTYRAVRDYFECEPLGALTVKGKAEPVVAYRALQETAVHTRFEAAAERGLTPFVGRNQELTVLRGYLEQARRGQGQVVFISGEAGIGKSRLLLEFRRSIQDEGVTWLEGHCISYGKNIPYLPVIDILKRGFGVQEGDNDDVIIAKVDEVAAQWEEEARCGVPYLKYLLSVDPGDPTVTAMEPLQRRAGIMDGLRAMLVEGSRRRPQVVAVEDLHWVDEKSEETLAALVDVIASAPVLLVLSYRPGYAPSLGERSYYSRVALGHLAPEESAVMAERVLQTATLPQQLQQLITGKAEGNPFYIEEVTKSLLESGALRKSNGSYALERPVEEIRIPDTIQEVILSRIDRMETGAKQAIQLASVIGREFTVRLLERISDVEGKLGDLLAELKSLELIYEKAYFPELSYMFKHALTHDVAYSTLLLERRKALHRIVAAAIEELYAERLPEQYETLAYHYYEGQEWEQALDYLLKAGRKAVAAYANQDAITYLTKGLELLKTLPDSPERAQQELDLQVTIAPVLRAVHGYTAPEVERCLTRAQELCRQVGDTPQLFPVLWGLWVVYFIRGELQAAGELAEQLLSLAQREDDPAPIMEAHRLLGATLFELGELSPARAHLEQVITLYDPQEHRSHAFLYGQDPAMAALSYGTWIVWLLGYPGQALDKGRRALTLAQELSHPYSVAYALIANAWVHQFRREVQGVAERAEAAITLCTEQGFFEFGAWGAITRGWALAEQGQAEEGTAQIRQVLADLRAVGSRLFAPHHRAMLAEAHANAGQAEEGLSALAEALAIVDKTGERWWEAELHRLKGELLLMQGAAEAEVEACFHQALEISRGQQAKSLELRAATSLSRLWWGQGKKSEACRMLQEIYGWFTEGFDTADLQDAKALLAELA
jgi:class 3 adenylate cyclase/predicted ATPase